MSSLLSTLADITGGCEGVFSVLSEVPKLSNIFILSRILGCRRRLSVSSAEDESSMDLVLDTEVLGLGAGAEAGGAITIGDWTLTGRGVGLGAGV